MEEYVLTPLESLKTMADTVRKATGTTGPMSFDELMSANQEIVESGGGGSEGDDEAAIIWIYELMLVGSSEISFTYYNADEEAWTNITHSILGNTMRMSLLTYNNSYIYIHGSHSVTVESIGDYPAEEICQVYTITDKDHVIHINVENPDPEGDYGICITASSV